MDTPLLDLAPGLAAAAQIVGEIPADPEIDPPSRPPQRAVRGDSTEIAEADQDCKPE
ncbi:MAG TPA: hypothetical protein VGB82_03955 [Alphaproteobacteria bacterium]